MLIARAVRLECHTNFFYYLSRTTHNTKIMNHRVMLKTCAITLVFVGMMCMAVYGTSKAAMAQASQASGQANNTGTQRSEEAKTTYKPEYPGVQSDSRNTLTIQTDKHLYKPGEVVTVKGSILASVLADLGSLDVVKIKVTDNNGTTVSGDDAALDSAGLFETSFTLPDEAKLGAYTVNATIEADANVLDTLDANISAHLSKSIKFAVVNPVAFAVKAENKDFQVKIASNSSSVRGVAFDQAEKKVSFKVEGETGTRGVAQVTLPKELLAGNMTVTIDGRAIAEDSNDVIVTSDTSTEMTLEINYHHSEHTIEIIGTSVVPEFPIAGLVMVAALGSVVAIVTFAGKHKFLSRT